MKATQSSMWIVKLRGELESKVPIHIIDDYNSTTVEITNANEIKSFCKTLEGLETTQYSWHIRKRSDGKRICWIHKNS